MKKIILSIIVLFAVCILMITISGCFVQDLLDPHRKDYLEAINMYDTGEYKPAADIFAELGLSDKFSITCLTIFSTNSVCIKTHIPFANAQGTKRDERKRVPSERLKNIIIVKYISKKI